MLTDIRIRAASAADAQAIFAAHLDSVLGLCGPAYSPAQLDAWFAGRSSEVHMPAIEAGRIWLAEQEGRVDGFVGHAPGEVTHLFVRPGAAGFGLGKRLFAFGIAKAAVGFEGPLTVVATLNALPFYQSFGFVPVEELKMLRGVPQVEIGVVKMQRPMGWTGDRA